MTTGRSCSWCRTCNAMLLVGPTFCRQCGHRADLPRLDCDCLACRRQRARAEAAALERLKDHEPEEN
jgi:predicted Zn-ribbon and HTH transcriptional regulator